MSNIILASKLRVRAKNFRHILGRLVIELMADQFEFGKITSKEALKVTGKLDKFADTGFCKIGLILDAFEILKPSNAQIEVMIQIVNSKMKLRQNRSM